MNHDVVCLNCGVKFTVQHARYNLSKYKHFFCERKCQLDYQTDNPSCYIRNTHMSRKLEQKLLLMKDAYDELKKGGDRNEIREKYYRELRQL